MVLWITSYGRSGNTFFRVVLHHLYGVHTFAAFNASEVLLNAGADRLVGYRELPPRLQAAVKERDDLQIKCALDELEASSELFIFKTHAWATDLFGTNYRAILLVRDGRDALVSYANYLVDIRFDAAALRKRLRQMTSSRSAFCSRKAWKHLMKIAGMSAAKSIGLRRWLVSGRIDYLLREPSTSYLDWSTMNRSWLERDPKPVIVYFNDLVRNPIQTVKRAMEKTGITLPSRAAASIPSFHELKASYPSFFRRGASGDWRNHLSAAQQISFDLRHRVTMERLGFYV